MSDDSVIETHGLTRYFGRRAALESVSLAVPRGAVFALLGRNGSGKSTLIQIVLGLLSPTRGRSAIFGEDSTTLTPATIARIGHTPENHPLPMSMRVRDVQAFQQASFPKFDEQTCRVVLEPFNIDPAQKVGQLSRGQRAGVAIALALAPMPELLVMDDPALGLDPLARRTLLEAMLLATRRAGSTILFTSHLLDDVERVADHVAVLDRSVLRVCCPLDTLLRRVRRFAIETNTAENPSEHPANNDGPLLALPNLLQARREGGRLIVTLANADDSAAADLRRLAGGASVAVLPLTLEEAVIGYLGERKHSVSMLDRVPAAVVTPSALEVA